MATASPFLKWVGGKGKLRHALERLLPHGAELMRHVEPFVGGGALFFSRQPTRALLCDVNQDLIGAYEAVRSDVSGVIGHLETHAREHGKAHYYAVRQRYNARDTCDPARRAAMFIYLNKTCFNGLYRVNRKGEFNVPIGRYTNPTIVNAEVLISASRALRAADLRCAPFEDMLRDAGQGDFVYLDPPYEPASRTSNFTGYAANGFAQHDQRTLRDVFQRLDRRGAKVMLSNSDVPFIRELYHGYALETVSVLRSINCNPNKRGPVQEVVVRNY